MPETDDVMTWKHFPYYWPFVLGIFFVSSKFDIHSKYHVRFPLVIQIGWQDLRKFHSSSSVNLWSACLVPNHYLNQCWIIVNWNNRNKFQRNLTQNGGFHLQKWISNCLQNGEHFVSASMLKHWGLRQMVAIFHTTFSNAFSRKKTLEFRLSFQLTLFLRVKLTMIQHWFR